jgi:[ribosomal protein S18]-alanine N-acetyltransferase
MSVDGFRLRPMTGSDLATVHALDCASHLTPWSRGNFSDALAAGNLCLVIEQKGAVVAYAVLQLAAGEAELLTMAVAPSMRRRGVGRQLLEELLASASTYRAVSCWLEARVSNTAAIGLYRAAGFADCGWRKGYYQTDSGREDALMMRRLLRPAGEKC